MIEKIYKSLTRFLLNLKLKNKLLLSYLFLIIIPLCIYTAVSYTTVNRILEKHITFSATRAFDQASEFLFYKISKIIKTSDVIATDNTMNSTLEKNLESYTLPEQYKDMNNLRQYLDSFRDDSDGIRVGLYVRDELVYSSENVNLYSLSSAEKSKWYSVFMNFSPRQLLCPPDYLDNEKQENGKVLALIRSLKESDDYSKTLAYMRIDFQEKGIRDILDNANTVSGSLTYLQNSKDVLVSSTDQALYEKFRLPSSQVNQLVPAPDWTMMVINDEKTFVKVRTVQNTDWSIITVIPLKEIFSDIDRLKTTLLVLMLVIGTVAYIIAVYITQNITKRINKLIKRMKIIQGGSFENILMKAGSTDEIGELTQNYNYMINRIVTLMNEQYEAGQKLKNAELRALQSQINPHFLYNTLDMVNWMSYGENGEEIRTLVKSLSTFYKLSLNMGRYIVPIKDELKHVSLYVQIQNIRLNHKINLTLDVTDEIREHHIIRVTLQPIVENSILHGIMEKPEKKGTISVMAEIVDETIVINVTDDGVGIKPEKLKSLLGENLSNNQGQGFGIKNIHERIKLYFGPEYGLTISSQYGEGTTVSIKLPLSDPES